MVLAIFTQMAGSECYYLKIISQTVEIRNFFLNLVKFNRNKNSVVCLLNHSDGATGINNEN